MRKAFAFSCVLLSVLLTACQSPYRLLSLIGLSQKPLVVSLLVADQPAIDTPPSPLNPFAPYDAFFAALGRATQRQVTPDLCFPFQLGPNLSLGLSHVALVTAAQYSSLAAGDGFQALAVAVDEQGRTSRAAVLLAPATASGMKIEDLRGKSVAFGPAGAARTHLLALAMLNEHGLRQEDLALQPLPIPGSLKHLPNADSVLASVMSGSSAAGFIDELAWDRLPESADKVDAPARDRFVILGRTSPSPNMLVVASNGLNADLAGRIRGFLMRAGADAPESLRGMGFLGFAAPTEAELTTCHNLKVPAASMPASESTTQP